MKQLAISVCLGLIGMCWVLPSAAQEAAAPTRKIVVPTVTRNVMVFGGLENSLAEAIGRRDAEAVGKLLGDRFEMRTDSQPGTPVPRDAWLQHAMEGAAFNSKVDQMAVHEYGDMMVVSFLWHLGRDGRNAAEVFVVDTWKSVDGNWKLDVRYASAAHGTAAPIPGDEPVKTQDKKKL
ncbi:MAG TPA: nuclear transport factor 2 family protein [Burkholderiaceae bacterium]